MQTRFHAAAGLAILLIASFASAGQSPIITRDADRRATVRAIRLTTPLRMDGRLEDDVYKTVPAISDFIQTLPNGGAEPTERTEAWIMFDANFVYVAARCWDSAPPDKWTVNELRRDTNQLRQNDHFGVSFDTFHDRRNGYLFYANPIGAMADSYMTDESNNNADWNPVWEARTGRFDGGWTVEMAIPFKSLRYVSGPSQVWGVNIRRSIRRKNEWDHLNPLPLSVGGANGMMRISDDATLVGLDLPAASKNVELKPYGISRITTDTLKTPPVSNEADADVGLDAKYGITANLTADLTINTDFAQVEVDEQQVNLTRFALQLPEKRDFFLEGRGIFDFGRAGGASGGGNASASAAAPTLFYSRRIGLNGSLVVPIQAGGRVTGKVGKVSVGAMNVETGQDTATATPATNFTVIRLKRDILRRSAIGGIFANRSESVVEKSASNQTYGVDGSFSFFQNVAMGGYYAVSATPHHAEDNASYQGRVEYGGDRYGAKIDYLNVGDHFTPEVGLVRRDDFDRTFGSVRFSPRPARSRVRRYTWEGTLEYLVNGASQLETRQRGGSFSAEFQNSDMFNVDVADHYELFVKSNPISGITVPAGLYEFNDISTSYQFGQQRRISGNVSAKVGTFYDGHIWTLGFSGARVALLKQWSLEPSVSLNRVVLATGETTQTVLRARTDYGFSARMFAGGLVQYSSSDHVFSSNIRFRWEYQPGSEFFLVYTDERDTTTPSYPDLKNRAFVVKVTRLFRF